MVTLVVHHPVHDYDAWKPVFDEHESVRRAHGEAEHRLYRFRDAPNSVVVHNDFPSLDQAQGFMADPSLPEAMERAGVAAAPNLSFLEQTVRTVHGDPDAAAGALVVVHHRVEDAAAWKAVFDAYGPELRAQGVLESRVYQDPGEPNRIVVHLDTATDETARALAAGDGLRAMLTRAGAIGEPSPGVAYLAERKVYAAAIA
jgi:quinol monooxygenase YgiN